MNWFKKNKEVSKPLDSEALEGQLIVVSIVTSTSSNETCYVTEDEHLIRHSEVIEIFSH